MNNDELRIVTDRGTYKIHVGGWNDDVFEVEVQCYSRLEATLTLEYFFFLDKRRPRDDERCTLYFVQYFDNSMRSPHACCRITKRQSDLRIPGRAVKIKDTGEQ